MKIKLFPAAIAALLALSLAGCGASASPNPTPSDISSAVPEANPDAAEKITVLLDWTPNTNHTGLYVADKLGFYADVGLDIEIIEGSGESVAPLVASGRAQIGVDFQDSMAPALLSDVPVTAVAAILQHNTSGIISMKDNGVDRPKGMEGKTYATWDLPVEKATLKYVVEKDGGDFSKVKLIPNTVTDVIAALQTDIDAVWIYYGWDGVATEVKGLETNYFAFRDIDPVFDYYTPVLVGSNDFLKSNPEEVRAFLAATKMGYEYAMENPDEAAQILLDAVTGLDSNIVKESQRWLADQYAGQGETWGVIDPARWNAFYKWLWDNALLEREIAPDTGFTNDYLPK